MIRTAGIIGGLGPETTSVFYMDIVKKSRKFGTNPPLMIVSVPITFKSDESAITNTGNSEDLKDMLVEASKKLESSSDFIVIPCNTAHVFIDEIVNAVKIPVISIVKETAAEAESRKVERVGVLATTRTIDSKIFQTELARSGIIAEIPEKKEQRQISEIIIGILRGTKAEKNKEELLKTISKLGSRGAEAIILGCTDLQLLVKQSDTQLKLLDTTEILADAVVREIFSSV